MKRVFIVHGWGGNPQEGWLPWLKSNLENNNFEVHVPEMPNTDHPIISKWVSFLKERVGKCDSDTYFVGHSIGCQTILRYLNSLSSAEKAGGAVFVAGWFALMGLETEEEKKIAAPWMEDNVDNKKVRDKMTKSIAIFSDNDAYVPLANVAFFKNKLNSKTIIEKNKGHFSGSDGINELPSALESVLSLTR